MNTHKYGGLLLVVSVLQGIGTVSPLAAESHDAHLHGQAEMTLIRSGEVLYVTVATPAVNIVGFEHGPLSEQQQVSVDEARSALESITTILTVSGGGCGSEQIDVQTEGFAGGTVEGQGSHAEFIVNLQLRCPENTRQRIVTVNLFDHYDDIESINVQWVSETAQGAVTLHPHNSSFNLP